VRTEFSFEALAALNAMQADPAAKYAFEHMSGGFLWSDEVPPADTPGGRDVREDDLIRFLLAMRASLTLGKYESAEIPWLWQQVATHAPHWPGLLPERRSPRMRKRLLAAQRLAARCYRKLFEEDEWT